MVYESASFPVSSHMVYISFFSFLTFANGGSDGKVSACSAGDLGLIPWLGRSPGEGNGNPLQYPHLENCMLRGACQAAGQEVTKELDMTE